MVLKVLGHLLGFGGGRNIVRETVEVFRPNAEAGAVRASDLDQATLAQLAAEFASTKEQGWFGRLVDGLNRLPRPIMVLGVFGLLVATPASPAYMAQVFEAWKLIPTGMWAIIGTIVAFYFGGRAQIKELNFRKDLAASVALAPGVIKNMERLEALRFNSPGAAQGGPDAGTALSTVEPSDNPALEDWRKTRP